MLQVQTHSALHVHVCIVTEAGEVFAYLDKNDEG